MIVSANAGGLNGYAKNARLSIRCRTSGAFGLLVVRIHPSLRDFTSTQKLPDNITESFFIIWIPTSGTMLRSGKFCSRAQGGRKAGAGYTLDAMSEYVQEWVPTMVFDVDS